MDYIKENIHKIKEEVAKIAEKTGRSGDDIIIVGATKTVEADVINKAIEYGLVNIGENRVQELIKKYEKVSDKAVWHFIGHLQSNKVKYIMDKNMLIHSVDSERLLNEINKRAGDKGISARVLIEVNVSGEESKYGVSPEEVYQMIENNEQRDNVKIEGLMTIGPFGVSDEETRQVFRKLNNLFLDIERKKYNNSSMKYLSMGMSSDYEIAISEGANIIRIGSAIFGERKYN